MIRNKLVSASCRRFVGKTSTGPSSRSTPKRFFSKISVPNNTPSTGTSGELFVVRATPSSKGRGLFATKPISKGQVVIEEDPIVSGQIYVNRVNFKPPMRLSAHGHRLQNFVLCCDNCLVHLKSIDGNIEEVLPESKSYIPAPQARSPTGVLSFRMFGRVHHYCGSECFTAAWDNYHQVFEDESLRLPETTNSDDKEELSQEDIDSIKRLRKKVNSGKQIQMMNELYEDWDEVLPTLPLDLIFKSFAKEVILSNPKLKPMSSAREKSAPRKHLKVLEPLKAITKSPMSQLGPLVQRTTHLLNDILVQGPARICRFDIGEDLVEDTIRRFIANHLQIVLKAPKSLQKYLEWASSSKHVGHILELEKGLSNQGLDLGALWHSTGAAVYSTYCQMNHSCEPNLAVTQLQNETHKVSFVATRDIAPNEEITVSYLKHLDMDTRERKKVLKEEFAYDCKCQRCTSQR